MQNNPEPPARQDPARYAVESVTNAAKILLMLRESNQLQVGKVAESLGVARSTAHRLMTTLQSQGLLTQRGARSAYTAGAALVELGSSVMGAMDLRDIAGPSLERIAHETGETCHLLVLRDSEVQFIAGSEGRHAIRAALRIGAREHAHTSAAGKALLALLPPEELRRRFPQSRLTGGTDSAIRTRSALEAELATIRTLGYAVNDSESEADLIAVSAAISDAGGGALGAISISGPASRLRDRVPAYGEMLTGLISDLPV